MTGAGRGGQDGSVWVERRAQASTIGVVLILAITIIGGGVVVVIGADALADTERTTSISKAEHSLTQFDSRAAMVALGETQSQRVTLGSSGKGQYAVDDDAGWIRVVHHNYTDNQHETIYNASLGTVTYENDDTIVAYQGGGVWRQQGNGTTMLSPPEFHYRGATLTLPVVRVTNTGSASGSTNALVSRASESRRIFPNETAAGTLDGEGAPYDVDSAGRYDNPVLNGTVSVTVHSQFYKGWADYFRTRTAGKVTVDHSNETATVELRTVGVVGAFPMADALDDDGLQVRGQSAGHSVTEFTLAFAKDQGTMNNMYFSFYAEEGPHRYETVIHVPQGTSCNGGLKSDEYLEVYTFYRNTDTGVQHEWANTTIPASGGPIRLVCGPSFDSTLIVDLTAEVDQTYGDHSVESDGSYYDWNGVEPTDTPAFSHEGIDGEPKTFADGDEVTTNSLTRHYFGLLGDDFTLNGRAGQGNRGGPQIDVDRSRGTLDYETGAGGYYITYLHITENEVTVELE